MDSTTVLRSEWRAQGDARGLMWFGPIGAVKDRSTPVPLLFYKSDSEKSDG